MLFDDIKVDNIIHNDMLYVNVSQLATHLAQATKRFALEASELAQTFGMTPQERVFILGLIHGMENTVTLLFQANDEYNISTIDTIEDLLEKFRNNDSI